MKTRRSFVAGTGGVIASSLLPGWLPFVEGGETTTIKKLEDRVEVLEKEAIHVGDLADRPDADEVPGGRRYLDERGIFNNGEIADTIKPFEIDQDSDIEHVPLNNVVEITPGESFYPVIRCLSGTDPLLVKAMSLTIY